MTSAGSSLVGNPLLNKVYAPREVFPIAQVCSSGVDAFASAALTPLLFLAAGRWPSPTAYWVPVLVLILIGAFTHFYVVFESVGALMVLFLWRPRQRPLMVAAAAGVMAISFLYLKLFVATHSQIVMGNYWIQNTLAWYSFELKFAAFVI